MTESNEPLLGSDVWPSGTESWGILYGPRGAAPFPIGDEKPRGGEEPVSNTDAWLNFLRRATGWVDLHSVWETLVWTIAEPEDPGWRPRQIAWGEFEKLGLRDASLTKALTWYALGESLISAQPSSAFADAAGAPRPEIVTPLENDGYEVASRSGTETYLQAYPALIHLLHKIPAKIRTYFGEEAGLRLQVLEDPDGHPGSFDLVLHIIDRRDVEQAMEALRRFDEEWWIDISQGAVGNLIVDVDYTQCSTGTSSIA